MKQIIITLETADIIALEKGGDKAAITKVGKYYRLLISKVLCSTQMFFCFKRNTRIVSASVVDAAHFIFISYCTFSFLLWSMF